MKTHELRSWAADVVLQTLDGNLTSERAIGFAEGAISSAKLVGAIKGDEYEAARIALNGREVPGHLDIWWAAYARPTA